MRSLRATTPLELRNRAHRLAQQPVGTPAHHHNQQDRSGHDLDFSQDLRVAGRNVEQAWHLHEQGHDDGGRQRTAEHVPGSADHDARQGEDGLANRPGRGSEGADVQDGQGARQPGDHPAEYEDLELRPEWVFPEHLQRGFVLPDGPAETPERGTLDAPGEHVHDGCEGGDHKQVPGPVGRGGQGRAEGLRNVDQAFDAVEQIRLPAEER